MKLHHILLISAGVLLSSCATNTSVPVSNNISQVNLTWTKSGKLYADAVEIPLISKNPPARFRPELLIDHLKSRDSNREIKVIQLVREGGATSAFDANTMTKLVSFAKSESITIKGPQVFEDYRSVGPFEFRQYH